MNAIKKDLLKQIITPYIYIFFLIAFSSNCFAQEFTLSLSSKNLLDNLVLKKIEFKKTHKDSTSIYTEVNKVSSVIKKLGYFTNTIDSLYKKKENITAYFTLGSKIDNVIIINSSNNLLKLLSIKKTNDSIIIPIEELEFTLNSISEKLENNGASFSKAYLTNIEIKDKDIYGDLKIQESKERIIDSVIIKGYELFSKSHIKQYFKIGKKALFNQKKINKVSTLSRSLSFVKEIKAPEILFTKDSTLLYIYLKKQQNNSFDGLINFSSTENGNLLFNGYLDLELNNIINTGEQFKLYWNRIDEETQEFEASTVLPYIFNTPITPSISFNIFKQDSTFLNTEFNTNISYNINNSTRITATTSSINSTNLQKNKIDNTITSYESQFFGIKFRYSIPTNDTFKNDKFLIEIDPAFGRRTIENTTTNQFRFKLNIGYIWNINKKNSFSIKNKTGYLKSDTYLENELFRLGGTRSIRGFNEKSIYTNNYSYFNLEYRFLTSDTSFIYTVTDIGKVELKNTQQNLTGIGLGYLFKTNNSQISISSVFGKTNTDKFKSKNSKIIISWKNYF